MKSICGGSVKPLNLQQNGRLPVNVKFIIEGEERLASSLRPFLKNINPLLTSDFALNTDAG